MKRILRWWPLIPLIWFGTLIGVMTPGSLEIRPNVAFEFSLLIYDPADIGAFVLRGANASMGRLPGRRDEPTWSEPEDVARRLDAAPQPLEPRYYLEYPSATLVLFRLGFPMPCAMPAAVADSHHFGIAHFEPRNEAEADLWLRFQIAAIIIVAIMLASWYGLFAVLRHGYVPGMPTGPLWLAALPAAVFFSLNRFDIVPALCTALAFHQLGRKRDAWSGAALAIGVLLKVYPVLFVPIIVRHLGVRRGAIWLAGFTGMMGLGVGLSTLVLGWEPTVQPVLVQLARPLEEKSWTLYGRVFPLELGHEKNLRLAILAAAGLGLVVWRPPSLPSVLRRCAALLVIFISLAVFWSPQWVVWFLPLVIPLAARARWLVGVCVALDLLNYLQFPVLFWIVWNHLDKATCENIAEVLIYVRAALWLTLAAGLLVQDWRHQVSESQSS